MTIKNTVDVENLMRKRVEAMEDLDCLDLERCVMNLMYLHTAVKFMEVTKDNASDEKDPMQLKILQDSFNDFALVARQCVGVIDELTLRTDAAE